MSLEFALAALLAALAAGVVAGIRHVPEGKVLTLHRFGQFVRALPPGLHFTLPVLDQVAHEVDLVGHHVALPVPTAASRAELYFQILDPQQAGDALDEVDELVLRLARDRLSQLGAAALDEPARLAGRLKDELNQRLLPRGLRITRCQLA